jgi:hypothetical protein
MKRGPIYCKKTAGRVLSQGANVIQLEKLRRGREWKINLACRATQTAHNNPRDLRA